MNDQLQILIELYEEEIDRLKTLIAECLSEEEYMHAHFHSNALYEANVKLRTLHNIADNLYDEKRFNLRTKFLLDRLLRKTDSEDLKELYLHGILSAEAALERLNQAPSRTEKEKSISLLENTLQRLMDKKVKNVRLILNKSKNFHLTFVYSNNGMKVTIPYIQTHVRKRFLSEMNLKPIQQLGFTFASNERKLVLTITGNKKDILDKLNPILSKIVFEVFYFKEFENDSYIQYTDRASH